MDKSISCVTLGFWARVKAVFSGKVVSSDVCSIVKAKVAVLSKEVRDLTDDLEKSKQEVTFMAGLRDIDARKYAELEVKFEKQNFQYSITNSERDSYRAEVIALTQTNGRLASKIAMLEKKLEATTVEVTKKVMSASNSKKLDCPKIKQARADIKAGKTNITDAAIALGVHESTLARALNGTTYAYCAEDKPKSEKECVPVEEPAIAETPVERTQLTCEGIQAVRDGLAKKVKSIEAYASEYGISVSSLKKALACQTYKKCCKKNKKSK